ncbi:MAG: hypothetical protein P4L55_23960 [Syntrophobacteraceae bacterium]|nr:hypothetical protein [Syntrophobacteraceae bacterium]
MVEDDDEDDEDDDVSLESDSDFMVANKSCISLPSACAGFWEEPVDELESAESVESVDEVESVDDVEPVDEAAEVELEFEPASGGGPLGGGGMDNPIWFSVCITPCISESFPELDPPSACWTPEFEFPLFD